MVKQIALIESCPKSATCRIRRLLEMASLVPSAGKF